MHVTKIQYKMHIKIHSDSMNKAAIHEQITCQTTKTNAHTSTAESYVRARTQP